MQCITEKPTYHHGDLRSALIDAGFELARGGGEAAVVLREATRAVGVSPRAAYRHFVDRDALVTAVAHRALASLAERIEAHQAGLSASDPRALDRLAAVGSGYVEWALDNPGLFDVAFFGLDEMSAAVEPAAAGPSGLTAYQLLHRAIDELVADGRIAEAESGDVANLCWASVHGIAVLMTRGPFRELDRAGADRLTIGMLAALIARLGGCSHSAR